MENQHQEFRIAYQALNNATDAYHRQMTNALGGDVAARENIQPLLAEIEQLRVRFISVAESLVASRAL